MVVLLITGCGSKSKLPEVPPDDFSMSHESGGSQSSTFTRYRLYTTSKGEYRLRVRLYTPVAYGKQDTYTVSRSYKVPRKDFQKIYRLLRESRFFRLKEKSPDELNVGDCGFTKFRVQAGKLDHEITIFCTNREPWSSLKGSLVKLGRKYDVDWQKLRERLDEKIN
ncbi:MAG: hypothetical protein ABEJ65_07760 [bacterium]